MNNKMVSQTVLASFVPGLGNIPPTIKSSRTIPSTAVGAWGMATFTHSVALEASDAIPEIHANISGIGGSDYYFLIEGIFSRDHPSLPFTIGISFTFTATTINFVITYLNNNGAGGTASGTINFEIFRYQAPWQ